MADNRDSQRVGAVPPYESRARGKSRVRIYAADSKPQHAPVTDQKAPKPEAAKAK
jgi:hypothetical protein